MKKISITLSALLFCTSVAFALFVGRPSNQKRKMMIHKGDNYNKYWQKVKEYDKQRLPKSALAVIDSIYTIAKADKNQEQSIKALLHRAKYQQNVKEQSFLKSIAFFKDEAEKAPFPEKQILYSIIAEEFWNYYQRNQWQISQRTHTQNYDLEDIETWDIRTITEEATKYYLLSLEEKDLLSRTDLYAFEELIIKGKDSFEKQTENLRPTLYDFLAHRAIDVFNNDVVSITKASETFELDKESYFAPARIFVQDKIAIQDSSNLKNYAFKLLQELTESHLQDTDKTALIDLELKRLRLVKHNSVLNNTDSLYLNTLNQLYNKYKKSPTAGEILYEIANIHAQQSKKYNHKEGKKYKGEAEKAIRYCYTGIQQYPKTYGAQQCQNLLDNLKSKELNIQGEDYIVPNQASKILVKYKNIEKFYAKIIPINKAEFNDWLQSLDYKNRDRKIHQKIESYTALNTWEVKLPYDQDYNQHSTEIKIEALPIGDYMLVLSSDKNFARENQSYQCQIFGVSNLAYIEKDNSNAIKTYYVTNRNTGKPLSDVKAEVFLRNYNYKLKKYERTKIKTFTTDENGTFTITPHNIKTYRNRSNYYIVLSKDKDRLDTDRSHYLYYRGSYLKESYLHTHFFTDRAIYRPGQTIHFKGIVLKEDADIQIKSNYNTIVRLTDVNYQTIAELNVTTNEYGSFSGKFTLPDDVLTGSFKLKENYGSKNIQVEEYKRPTFEVNFKPIKGTYKLNEAVNVEGEAKTYSGAGLDNVEVSYRVVRNGVFPYWCWYRWGYMPTSPEVEITNGTTTTNQQGKFNIDFTALADKNIENKFSPTYTYTVYATVTDINGETHSNTTFVRVSTQALVLNIDVPKKALLQNFDEIKIKTTNLNGEAETAQVKVEMWSLATPKKYFINRKWAVPEKQIMSQADFVKDFPFEAYGEENKIQHWAKKEQLLNTETATPQGNTIKINTNKWKAGNYKIVATTQDKFGNKVEAIQYITLIDSKSKKPISNTLFSIIPLQNKTSYEPGEKAEFLLSTNAKDLHLYYEIEKRSGANSQWLHLSQEQKKISIPITKADRGNFTIHFMYIKHNQSFTESKVIQVPYSNKKLDISFATFRNKLQPGQNEEWQINIKGAKGEKVVAELLATMYDASLDAFVENNWSFDIWKNYYSNISWDNNSQFGTQTPQNFSLDWNNIISLPYRSYDQLNRFGYYHYRYYGEVQIRGSRQVVDIASVSRPTKAKKARRMANDIELEEEVAEEVSYSAPLIDKKESSLQAVAKDDALPENKNKPSLANIKARKNFNETAFFFPHLQTDAQGNISIKFTAPESLTEWKIMTLAHTKDLASAIKINELVTQKELMLYPNAPRFFRENDAMTFSTKIVSLANKDLQGQAQIFFYNALNGKDITATLLAQNKAIKDFSVPAEKSTAVQWQIKIPETYQAIRYKVVAQAGNFSDGEEKAIPVLSNRMLVTESMPLSIRGKESKTFQFKKLIQNTSPTLKNHKLTLEFTANPAWYAIQALPYLMEYPYECAEQTFSRYYANAIASHIANSSPKIKEVFTAWENQSPDAFLSNLEKNQELKALLLEETPWVLQAQDESERKRRIGVLFNLNKMSKELNKALKRLQKMQKYNGGWAWFDRMPESRYITQHIASGMGHLDHLGIKDVRQNAKTWQMLKKAIQYLDNQIQTDYQKLKNYDKDLNKEHISYHQIQYLYMRSFFLGIPIQHKEAYNYYFAQAKKYWTNQSQYMQAMIALAMHRSNESQTAKAILASIKEYSIESEEMGMYWKNNGGGYYWYQAPIERQALFIEAFGEITEDQKAVEAMKVWLLKQKQTQDWKTTRATTEACYALLLQGANWLATDNAVEIQVGNQIIDTQNNADIKVEAGTGYFKTSWAGKDITPAMGNVYITKKDDGVSWGAMYWQYFEQLDNITPAKTPLSINKELFIVKNTAQGEVIEPISEKTAVKVGEKVRVRTIIRTDRAMEYVHLKDMRASGFEPINVLSGYRYQDGLGYYQATKDASTNFFISWLAKGTYVFEYDLRANIAGNFSNGITSIQCMYAPEFTSHSKGVRVQIQP